MKRALRSAPLLLIAVVASVAGAATLPRATHLPSKPVDPRARAVRPAPLGLRAASGPSYRPGELLVVDDAGPALTLGRARELAVHEPVVSATLERLGITRFERVGRGHPAARSIYRLTSTRADFDPVSAAQELSATGRFRVVSPNYRLQLFDTTPGDFYFSSQWQASADDPGAVSLPQAWDYQQGSASVKVCVLDLGIDVDHPDLVAKIWTNPGEIPGNGIDDDNNGYIDDVRGWDFGDDDNDPSPTVLKEAVGPPFEPDSIDIAFHGTFAAGLALASANNDGEGIAGVDWNAQLVAVKITDSNGEIYTDRFAAAMEYAVAAGADIMSISLGSEDPGSRAMFQALVDIALDADAVVVASAGNSASSDPVYPAACDSVISVASTSSGGALSAFSNFGPWVDIAAPGDLVFSCLHRNYEYDPLSQVYYWLFFGWDFIGPYMYGSGTSFSAPIVAGACALTKAAFPAVPWTSHRMERYLVSQGDAMPFTSTIGQGPYTNRKLNVLNAVLPPPAAVGDRPAATATFTAWPNPSTRLTRIGLSMARTGAADLAVFDVTGRQVHDLHHGTLGAGAHEFTWSGADDAGRPMPPGIYEARLQTLEGAERLRIVRVR